MSLEESVLSTLRYTAHYDFPLTKKELWYWLMTDQSVSYPDFLKSLKNVTVPKKLKPYLIEQLSADRLQKRKETARKLSKIKSALKILKKIPFVLFIGLTGSLSMDNADPESDIDLMIITQPYSLWLTRPLIAFLFWANGQDLRRSKASYTKDTICINLYLDQTSLAIPITKRNFYVAHEILQVKPLYDKDGAFDSFLLANKWVSNHYANAYIHKQQARSQLYISFSSLWLYPLNFLFYFAQKTYMSGKITNETVSLTQAFFHPKNPYTRLKSQVSLI